MAKDKVETEASSETPGSPDTEKKVAGFGTFKGVFVPSVLTIMGVIMYLRMGWVVGNVGLIGALVIVTMASSITFLTSLAIAATATNMKVKGGGAYFMISRSFGIEAGAAIGLPLYLAQALGISFYLAGFAESLHPFIPGVPLPIIGFISLGALTLLAYFSANLALKAQIFIFGLILLSLVSFFLGSPVDGFSTSVTDAPPIEISPSFWVVFAVFFPAVTGIEAGISMSGNLKDAGRSLPRGTIAAVLCGFLVYLLIPIFLWKFAPESILKSSPTVMADVSAWPWAIYVGLWGATLSSGLGALLGAPRTLQALANDRVLPGFIGKSYGKAKDPRIATALTFLVAIAGLSLGSLDLIAPILSMFFLTSYGALNLIAGLEGLIGNPSWRPTFRTPWVLSLIGACACFGTMLMINAGATLIALVCVSGVYLLMLRRRINAGWSDMRRGLLLYLARSSIYRLSDLSKDPKTWRPNMLVLSGSPTSRWYLIELADAISHGKGFLTVATVLTQTHFDEEKLTSLEKSVKSFLDKQNIPALVKVKCADDFVTAVEGLVTDYGLGPLEPNTVLFGDTEKEENFIDFSQIICSVHAARKNMLVVRENSAAADRRFANAGARRSKTIDVWWGRQHDNAALMLVMAYMLQTSPEWMGSKLNLKSLVQSEEERQGVLESLKTFVDEGRFEAEVLVYVASDDRNSFDDIARFSRDTDLVFIGMKPPVEGETAEDYSEYYEDLIVHTNQFPLTVITLAGENIEFKDIFK